MDSVYDTNEVGIGNDVFHCIYDQVITIPVVKTYWNMMLDQILKRIKPCFQVSNFDWNLDEYDLRLDNSLDLGSILELTYQLKIFKFVAHSKYVKSEVDDNDIEE